MGSHVIFLARCMKKNKMKLNLLKKIKAKYTLWHIEVATLVLGEDHGENW